MLAPQPFFRFIFFAFLYVSPQVSGKIASNEFYLYEDALKQLTAETANHLYKQGKFKRVENNELNKGITRSIFWLAYTNHNDLPPDSLLLYIGQHHINRIHFFFVHHNMITQQWVTGDYYPFSQRPVPATGFYFPIDKKGIYLARIDKSNETVQLSFHLVSRLEAITAESNNKIIMSLFSGMILLLVIFGVYLFIITKDNVYLF